MALLHITDARGRQRQHSLSPQSVCTIERAPDNQSTLNDGRVSRSHAHIKFERDAYFIFNELVEGSEIKRSANKVFINGQPRGERALSDGDQITIGKNAQGGQILLSAATATASSGNPYTLSPPLFLKSNDIGK